LVSGTRALRIDTALDDLYSEFAVVVEQGLAGPLAFPFRVVHLAAETGSLAMLVEAHAHDSVQIAFHRDKTVQGRPQAITTNRQDQGFHFAVLLHHVNGGVALLALDPGDVFTALERLGGFRVLGGL